MILNLACGENRIPGCINIDKFTQCDLKSDISALPFKDNTIDTIYLFHAIEHFEEPRQIILLNHIWDKLKFDGRLVISYPEFVKCAQGYIDNTKGQRDFFKKTIYGRQNHAGDYHYSLMDTRFFKPLLEQLGFKEIVDFAEKDQEFNTVVKCRKDNKPITQEALYRKILWNID